MPEINHQIFDRTLAEVDKAIVENTRRKGEKQYKRISAGSIGKECLRSLWYDFKLVSEKEVDLNDPEEVKKEALSQKRFDDGHTQEAKMEERLRLLPFIELHTIDPNSKNPINKQYRFTFLDGHFSMYVDGVIKGLIESPNKWHVWEHKSVKEEDFEKLKKLRIKKGEKNAFKEWNYNYWVQAQCCMHGAELDRHYLTVSNPGGRDFISVRTEKSLSAIDGFLEKAHQAIKGPLPDKISKDREFYQCKWCDHRAVCHDNATPLINCGTCKLRTIEENGKFSCYWVAPGYLKNMEPCEHHDILDCFSFEQIIKSEFNGTPATPDERIDNLNLENKGRIWD